MRTLVACVAAKSPFPAQVQAAYEGYEDGADMAPLYLAQGKDLRETLGVVAAQLDARGGDEAIRALYVRAMTRVAEDGDYAAASALRVRAVEESRRRPRR